MASILVLALAFMAASAAEKPLPVTCGSTVKLGHVETGYLLHSHEVQYGRQGGGSGLQSITGYPEANDYNSHWLITGHSGAPCLLGQPVTKGQVLRLQHASTKKWLHSSSRHISPLTNQQEISAFGGYDQSDSGDLWKITWEGSASQWNQDTKVKLQHVDTSAYLSCHRRAYGDPIPGQLEVFGTKKKTGNASWLAAEGVYFPVDPESTKKGSAKGSGQGEPHVEL